MLLLYVTFLFYFAEIICNDLCRFRGNREGGVAENAAYYVFTHAPDGAIEAFPLQEWYNFQPIQRYKSLTAEEAEEEFGRFVPLTHVWVDPREPAALSSHHFHVFNAFQSLVQPSCSGSSCRSLSVCFDFSALFGAHLFYTVKPFLF
jgi:hypothetical protein